MVVSFIFNRWEANSGRYVLGNFLPFYLKMWCLLGQHELFFNKTCVSEFLFNIWVVTRRSFHRVFSSNLVFSIRTILGFMARTLEFSGPFSGICSNTQLFHNFSCVSLRLPARAHHYLCFFLFCCFQKPQTDTNSWSSVIWELKQIWEITRPVFTKAQQLTLFGFWRKQVLCLRLLKDKISI